MRAIIVFFLDEHDIPRDEPRSLEMQALPSLTMAADPAAASPLWTWFIENPRTETPGEIAA